MRTNKQKLIEIAEEHFESMKRDITERMKDQIGNDNWYMSRAIEVYERVLVNTYFSGIDWIAKEECKNLAWVRPDLIKQGLAVPIGKTYYGSKNPLPFRWLDDDEGFEVCYCGEWIEAKSIDWDFEKPVAKEASNEMAEQAN